MPNPTQHTHRPFCLSAWQPESTFGWLERHQKVSESGTERERQSGEWNTLSLSLSPLLEKEGWKRDERESVFLLLFPGAASLFVVLLLLCSPPGITDTIQSTDTQTETTDAGTHTHNHECAGHIQFFTWKPGEHIHTKEKKKNRPPEHATSTPKHTLLFCLVRRGGCWG